MSAITKKFDDIPVSTSTIIGRTNWRINMEELYKALPITQYNVAKKRRGRRSKNDVKQEPQKLEDGNIITVKLGDQMKGVNLKNKKKKETMSGKNFFRNSLTLVMNNDDKFLNVKVSSNGVLQVTGAKNYDSVQKCIEKISGYIDTNNKVMSTVCNADAQGTLIPVMTNLNFNVGFLVNREKLDSYINNCTPYYSLLENSFGYAGVNIKFPLDPKKMELLKLRKIVHKNNVWEKSEINYKDYISGLSDKEKEKEDCKMRYVSFLVFHSGAVIESSVHTECMREAYEEFMEIIKKCRNLIEDKGVFPIENLMR
jgi:TATA-box binding protein (TBP) (component of TFIID and TFIIIB)